MATCQLVDKSHYTEHRTGIFLELGGRKTTVPENFAAFKKRATAEQRVNAQSDFEVSSVGADSLER